MRNVGGIQIFTIIQSTVINTYVYVAFFWRVASLGYISKSRITGTKN